MATVQKSKTQARIYSYEEYLALPKKLSKSMMSAVGIWRGRGSRDAVLYQRELRAEWEERMEKLGKVLKKR